MVRLLVVELLHFTASKKVLRITQSNATAPDLREKRTWGWGEILNKHSKPRVLPFLLGGLPAGLGSGLPDLLIFQDRAQIWIFT